MSCASGTSLSASSALVSDFSVSSGTTALEEVGAAVASFLPNGLNALKRPLNVDDEDDDDEPVDVPNAC